MMPANMWKMQMQVMLKLNKAILYSFGLHMGRLDGFERLIAGIYGTPDRVPVIAQPYTYAMGMHGLSAKTFFSQPRPFIHASWNMARYFGIDFWSPVFDFYNIELDALGQKLIWHDRSEPDVDTSDPLIKTEDDFKRLRPPRPGLDGRMPYVLESYKLYMELMGVPPMVYTCSPFTMAVLIRGYVNLIRDMRRNPAFTHRLMEFLSMEVVVPWIDKIVEATNASIVTMSDAWASQPNVTTEMVREFCLPYIEKIIRATNSPLRTVLDTASWGERSVQDPREVLDMKMDMMVPGNAFKALRPFFLLVWNEDYEETGIPLVRNYAEEKKVGLLLNLRPNIIEEGPPEAIVDSVRKLIGEGAGKGRFVLLINLVPIGTPVEHVHAAVAAARQFGAYPISPDLDGIKFRMPEFIPFEDWLKKEGLSV
jgi:uroporphyrinogen decarboxylase